MEKQAAVDEMIDAMQQSALRLNETNQELTSKRIDVDTRQNTLIEDFDLTKKDLDGTEQDIVNLIISRHSDALSDLKQMYEMEMNRLQDITGSIDELVSRMSSVCDDANGSCVDPTQLLTSHKEIMVQLREVENTELLEITASDKTELVFTDKHGAMTACIQESLPQLCDVKWLQCPLEKKEQRPHDNPGGDGREVKRSKRSALTITRKLSFIFWPFITTLTITIIIALIAILAHQSLKPVVEPSLCKVTLGHPSKKTGHFGGTLQTVDPHGNPLTTGGALVQAYYESQTDPATMTDNEDGTYDFLYDYRQWIQVSVNNVELLPHQFSPQVDPTSCLVYLGLPLDKEGFFRVIVMLADPEGERIDAGSANVEAYFTVVGERRPIPVQDNHDGTYEMTYSYNEWLRITINQVELRDQLWTQVDPDRCTVQLLQKPSETRSDHYIATVRTYDPKGRRINVGGVEVTANYEPQYSKEYIKVLDNGDGTYSYEYYFRNWVHVQINRVELVHQRKSRVDPKRCTVRLYKPANRDGYYMAKLKTVDSFGQPVTVGGAKVEAFYVSSKNRIVVHDLLDGTYVFEYDLKLWVRIKINDVDLQHINI